jgi:hypothetical protein
VNPAYASPMAIRRALTDRLRRLAAPHGPWPLADLHRQFAYDRLLTRLYEFDEGWLLKGAAALIARKLSTRHTVDIDLLRASSRQHAELDLRKAADADLRDWFTFTIGPGRPVADGVNGVRLPVVTHIGTQVFARFHVDLVTDDAHMTGTPDAVRPLADIVVPGLSRPGYLAYPLVDHIADKVIATFERYGPAELPSTRFKDLVDLVTLAAGVHVDAAALRSALDRQVQLRGLLLPTRFQVPDRQLWLRGYAAEARRSSDPIPATLDEAVASASQFLNPVLDGSAIGSWDPLLRDWS